MPLQVLHHVKGKSNENKIDLAKIYNQAIADYIDEATKQKLISTDTLYFGKRHFGQEDDFPNIELAPSVKNINVRLIDPELGKKIQEANKSSIYINLVGWVESDKAEFIFVTFSNGFEHQFDIYVNYQYDAKRKEYVLVNKKTELFSKK